MLAARSSRLSVLKVEDVMEEFMSPSGSSCATSAFWQKRDGEADEWMDREIQKREKVDNDIT